MVSRRPELLEELRGIAQVVWNPGTLRAPGAEIRRGIL
jgi:hypothetical protein